MRRGCPLRFRSRLSVTAGLCALLMLSPRLSSAGLDIPGSGGITVNGEQVTEMRVWQEYHYQNSVRSIIHSRDDERVDERILRSVIGQVVRKQLMLQEARRLDYTPMPGDMAEVRRIQVEQWKGERNFQSALMMLGVTEEFLLNRAAETLLIKKMAAGESKAEEGITESTLREHYRQTLGLYLPEEDPPLRYLFVPAEEAPPRAMYTRIAREAEPLSAGGAASFAALVQSYSRHASASQGGIVPEIGPGEVGLPRQPIRGKLKECRITPYLFDTTGLHVYLRDCRGPVPFPEVREGVRRDLIDTRRSQYLRDLVVRLEGQADIRYMSLTGAIPAKPGEGKGH